MWLLKAVRYWLLAFSEKRQEAFQALDRYNCCDQSKRESRLDRKSLKIQKAGLG